MSESLLDNSLEFLKGIGPAKSKLLKTGLELHSFRDLLHYYPFRYVDRTKISKISELQPDSDSVQFVAQVQQVKLEGAPRKQRLVARVSDGTGSMTLVWFRGLSYMQKFLTKEVPYLIYGKPSLFGSQLNIAHPEMEVFSPNKKLGLSLSPVYPTTDVLSKKGLDSKGIRVAQKNLQIKLEKVFFGDIIPDQIRQAFKLMSRNEALRKIHFPADNIELKRAQLAIKFEELFLYQFRLLYLRHTRKAQNRGFVFGLVGPLFNRFYQEKLPFELTGAQKRVVKEIRADLKSGTQMNRLLQGDVGSGKTMVALLSVLIALDNGFQTCLLAPTEILAQQHFVSITKYLEGLPINIGFLSGNVKGKTRKGLLSATAEGDIHLLIGTHALLEDPVIFKNLGLAITDEQHRFGVKQRAKLWAKNPTNPPHILVMTATPIPRTLAMTTYGDLDISVIDELPPGRKEVETRHWFENKRLLMFGFIKKQIEAGRQVYIVYPMIKESETLDLANLTEGYEAVSRVFEKDGFHIGVVHGKMRPEDKEFEMQRFIKKETKILVATTVIEVGVNVPNATVMVIENTERFGLSQLHQLRGRVGRGADQSYCILMSSFKLSKEAKKRIKIMCETNDGFKIAQADMEIRGPGVIDGTQQSGLSNLNLSNLVEDSKILMAARKSAQQLIELDPDLKKREHQRLKSELGKGEGKIKWKDIS